MKMLKNLKKNNKGFTLIEIVIVIVIIAILAAMLVPSMLSWIDTANQRTFLSAADTIKTSVTTSVSEKYAIDGTTVPDWDQVSKLVGSTVSAGDTSEYKVTLTMGTGDPVPKNNIATMVVENDKYSVTYTNDGSTATWGEVTAK